MKYLCEDRLALYEWVEKEELLALNNHNEQAGGSYGYVSELPVAEYDGRIQLRDLWLWVESQETVTISPEKFAEFFLPYLSEVSKKFGLIYYGCCELLHDRWKLIRSSIPNIRAVSISQWSNLERMGEMLGKNYVYSRKPMPTYISGETVYWEQLKEDVSRTVKAARGCNLEFIFRDLYKINDRSQLNKWTNRVRSLTNT